MQLVPLATGAFERLLDPRAVAHRCRLRCRLEHACVPSSAISRGIARCWELGFATLGSLIRSDAARWSSSGTRRVVVLAPHPDDEAIGCAGSILKHVGCGDRVSIVIATDGRRSQMIADTTKMSEQRRMEAAAAAQLLGDVRVEWLGLREGDWDLRELQSRLETLLDDIEPDVIYAPYVSIFTEHGARSHGRSTRMLAPNHGRSMCGVQVPLTPALSNLVVDVSDVAERCHAVPAHLAGRQVEWRITTPLRRATLCAAVEFWSFNARYASLH